MHHNKMQTENISENKCTLTCSNCVALNAGEILHLS